MRWTNPTIPLRHPSIKPFYHIGFITPPSRLESPPSYEKPPSPFKTTRELSHMASSTLVGRNAESLCRDEFNYPLALTCSRRSADLSGSNPYVHCFNNEKNSQKPQKQDPMPPSFHRTPVMLLDHSSSISSKSSPLHPVSYCLTSSFFRKYDNR